ncbi:helix-turn-helix domain-containing protein [Trueperella pyogenes]|uniref:helix-turn-helix domain-containing protein n=1 Tax=Trueperella pyogenes TaxID=1661 RepID=UPI0006B25158|nr:helix-turn-helix domain-containing protein [Trueperella pyogenes]
MLTENGIDLASPPKLYSLQAVSEAGYGSLSTLYRAIRDGRLEVIRIGGRTRVTPEALDAYVRAAANGGERR